MTTTSPSVRPGIRTRFGSHDETISLHLVSPSSTDRSPLKSWRNLPSPCGSHHFLERQLELEESEVQAGNQAHAKTRTINNITLGIIAYFAVAAGPFGVEDAVRAAGPYPVLLAVLLLPITWGLPQALMHNDRRKQWIHTVWVRHELGKYAGWVNALNCFASNICDLPTYPVLFCSYVEAFLASGYGYILSGTGRWLVKCLTLLLVFISNAVGMRAVAMASVLMSLFVLEPFVLEPPSIETFNLATWGSIAPEIDWSLFLSTILWNYQGELRSWDSLGCVAGEVKDGGRTYPIAIVIAMILITINYAFPVVFIAPELSNFSQWREGSLETVAMTIVPWSQAQSIRGNIFSIHIKEVDVHRSITQQAMEINQHRLPHDLRFTNEYKLNTRSNFLQFYVSNATAIGLI
ncbi:hypothetical protein PsorP6_009351 [Peronosclerospora sorghi]|uniref:Uncharacterized protein n=1 Tax=Peronosclerospora sorghi TaxID=230839 RepID=A0ACC0VY23_9STRA|nr:hypothetical protein PsorP6_009351 [Peronosclerospora sorghi]